MPKFNANISDKELAVLKQHSKDQGLSMTVLFKLWIKEVEKKLVKPPKNVEN